MQADGTTSRSGSTVAVVGSANADLVLRVDHRPAAGETVLGSDVVTTPGGKGANQAVAAGRLGAAVSFVGCVGQDPHGELLRESLTGAGVRTEGLRTVPAPTGNAVILLTGDGENSIIVSPGANRHLTPELADELGQHWRQAAVVVLQMEIAPETVRHVAQEAARGGARVVLNAAPASAPLPELLAVCDPLVVNEPEAAYLLSHSAGTSASLTVSDRGAGAAGTAGVVDPGVIVEDLLQLGPRSVVVTLGAQGAVLAERTETGRKAEPVHVPAAATEVVDTTGAGDAFVGAMAARLAEGADLPTAVRAATKVAGVAVARPGAQASYPTAEELRGG